LSNNINIYRSEAGHLSPHKKYSISFLILFFIVILVFSGLLIYGNAAEEADGGMLGGYRCKELSNVWFKISDDGVRNEISLPGTYKMDKDGTIAIETVLPFVIDEGTYLSMRSSASEVKVFIDGSLRSELDMSDSIFAGGYTPSAFLFVKLRGSDAAKKLRIEITSDSIFGGRVGRVFYGDQTGLLLYYVSGHLAESFLAFFLLIVSLIIIIISFFTEVRSHAALDIRYLAIFVVFISIWSISDSSLRQLLFHRIDAASFTAFFFQSFLALPLLFYIDEIQNGRFRKLYLTLEGLTAINAYICLALHLLRIVPYMRSLPVIMVVLTIDFTAITITIIIDIFKYKQKSYLISAYGIAAFMVSAAIELVFAMQAVNSQDKIFILTGSLLLLAFAVLKAVLYSVKVRAEKREALALADSKSRFLASMSHEIRTPINTVLGMNEMIERECTDKTILEYSDNIGTAGRMLLSIINDILDYSKIESGKMELTPVEYKTDSLIHDCLTLIQERADKKGLKLIVNCDADLPSKLSGDDVRIRQIITNLLTNAVKYTETGSVTLTVEGERTADELTLNDRDLKLADGVPLNDKDLKLCIKVKDTGIGIKTENIDKLFTDFSRIDNVNNRNIEGTGLGLAITKLLVEAMDGHIEVSSVYGEGSEFSVTIPQKIVDASPVGSLTKAPADQPAKKKKYQVSFRAPDAHILVVDDNKMNLMVFVQLLKQTGMHIDKASGGHEAIDLTRKQKYDIIFMDHMMPDIDGIETLKIIREEEDNPNKDTCIIALTANAIVGIEKKYLNAGFQAYLAKPVQPALLEKMVTDHLPDRLFTRNEEKEADDE
jgi:signal transduction histidine kinase/ActR/RegA family two-component response regulator